MIISEPEYTDQYKRDEKLVLYDFKNSEAVVLAHLLREEFLKFVQNLSYRMAITSSKLNLACALYESLHQTGIKHVVAQTHTVSSTFDVDGHSILVTITFNSRLFQPIWVIKFGINKHGCVFLLSIGKYPSPL